MNIFYTGLSTSAAVFVFASKFPTFPAMLSNFFTLYHIARDLQERLKGEKVSDVFSQAKNELVLSFSNECSLVVSCDPAFNTVYLRPRIPRAKRNSIDVFKPVQGTSVHSVSIQRADREITLSMDSGYDVVLQLYGSKANAFLTKGSRTIYRAFLHSRELDGSLLDPSHPDTSPETFDEFQARFQSIGHLTALSVMKKIYPLFGSVLIRETFFRAGIAEERTVAELTPSQGKTLFESARKLRTNLLESPDPRIYFEAGNPLVFSVLDLRSLSSYRVERFDSLQEGIRRFIGLRQKASGALREKADLEGNLRRELARVERALARIEEDARSEERAHEYELFGKLLMTHSPQAFKGETSLAMENMFSPRREAIEIPVDPRLSVVKNAERYFDKARKLRQALRESSGRRPDFSERYAALKDLTDSLDRRQTIEQWEEFKIQHRERLTLAGVHSPGAKQREPDLPPFRLFTVEGGFQVWAGKNSENNDLLTMKHARPHDLWFHARGSGGSHVILRVGSGKGEVSKKAIEQAASIAAYYSKMKTSRLVPVAMTYRKYVRKPRGAAAGTVSVEREKVLMVEPRLPDSNPHNP